MTQDPTKMFYFVNYLFNPKYLNSVLLEGWMKIKDLTYCEKEIIAPLLKHHKEAMHLCTVLNASAAEAQAAAEAAEKAKADGTAGLGPVTKRALTVPVSPRITAVRPPRFPEVFQISQKVEANEVPRYLNNWTLDKIEAENERRKKKAYEDTYNKYKETKCFQFQESSKAYKTLEETKREVEEERMADVDFNASFVKPVPDFSKNTAKVRLNASTILREDNLLRKQQAKDAELLKTYEMELRDPTEYYLWQTRMEEYDKQVALDQVAARREQAKQSSENTKYAVAKELEGKKLVANLMRKQGEQVKEQKKLQKELEIMDKQEIKEKVRKVRDTAPGIAVKKVHDKKVADGKIAKAELQKAIEEKKEEDKVIQAIKDDKIRQLQAVNNVHRKFIKVFDPTTVAGPLFLDQMSYMEMKERQSIARSKEEAALVIKNQDINDRKAKKAKEMQTRMEGIMRSREAKAVSNRAAKIKKVEDASQEVIRHEKKIETAAITLEQELRVRRQKKKDELAALKEEEEMIKRKQQYLGAAASAVDEKKAEELLKAQERKIQTTQIKLAEEAAKKEKRLVKNKLNANIIKRTEKIRAESIAREREVEALTAKRERLAKSREEILNKKAMAADGREQHERTAVVKFKSNPYAYSTTYGRDGFGLEPKTSLGETIIRKRMMSGTIET